MENPITFIENYLKAHNMYSVISIETLNLVKRDLKYTYFKCPWCKSEDHFAVMSNNNSLCSPLHCYISNNMGWVDKRMGQTIKQVLQKEEANFRNLLKRFDHLSNITPDQAFDLKTSKGCPEELLEDCMSKEDYQKFIVLLDVQKEKDKIKHKIY